MRREQSRRRAAIVVVVGGVNVGVGVHARARVATAVACFRRATRVALACVRVCRQFFLSLRTLTIIINIIIFFKKTEQFRRAINHSCLVLAVTSTAATLIARATRARRRRCAIERVEWRRRRCVRARRRCCNRERRRERNVAASCLRRHCTSRFV